MKYVVFSDIHGNQYALRRMLEETAGHVGGYLFLGDISGYYYGQRECMELLSSLPSHSVLLTGNHDANYLNAGGDSAFRHKLAEAYGKSYLADYGEDYRHWLRGLSPRQKKSIGGRRAGLFHGSPLDYENGRVYPDSALNAAEGYLDFDVVFLGHTHYRMARTAGGVLVINPGSLGQPRDGRGFSYVLFDFESMKPEFCRVRLSNGDKNALFEEIRRHGETAENESYLKSVLNRGDN